MSKNRLAISIEVAAPIQDVWDSIADWQSQGEWMLQTRVWVTSEISEGVGTSIAAFTGPLHKLYPRFSFLGLLDEMVVTSWQPPFQCDVDHVGRVLKGSGSFKLTSLSPTRTRFDWSETVIAPALLFAPLAPFLYLGVLLSLKRFARSFR